jgi:hypothetical protein
LSAGLLQLACGNGLPGTSPVCFSLDDATEERKPKWGGTRYFGDNRMGLLPGPDRHRCIQPAKAVTVRNNWLEEFVICPLFDDA